MQAYLSVSMTLDGNGYYGVIIVFNERLRYPEACKGQRQHHPPPPPPPHQTPHRQADRDWIRKLQRTTEHRSCYLKSSSMKCVMKKVLLHPPPLKKSNLSIMEMSSSLPFTWPFPTPYLHHPPPQIPSSLPLYFSPDFMTESKK